MIPRVADPRSSHRPRAGPHGFVAFQADGVTPVAYDPCRPIRYVMRPGAPPPAASSSSASAIARIAEVTGLEFVRDGASDEAATRDRPIHQPERYGDRWAPVLIGWETEAENPELAGDIVGEAGSAAVSLGAGPKVFVTGSVSWTPGGCWRSGSAPNGEATAGRSCCTNWVTWSAWRTWTTRTSSCTPRPGGDLVDFAAGDLNRARGPGSRDVRP